MPWKYEDVVVGTFTEILVSPRYLETELEDNDADFIFIFVVLQGDVQLVLLVVEVLLRGGNQAKSESVDLLLARDWGGEDVGEVGQDGAQVGDVDHAPDLDAGLVLR